MNKYLAEIFAEFTYAESMTYEDLLYNENLLMENLESIFKEGGTEHLDFTPLGDMLMAQCAMEIPNREILLDMAQEIAFILPKNIMGRMLCLHKNLKSYDLFWLSRGKWSEKEFNLPGKSPEGIKIQTVKVSDAITTGNQKKE